MSRPRTSSQPAMLPTNAIPAPIRRISLSPPMNAWLAASTRLMRGTAAGPRRGRPRAAPDETASENADGRLRQQARASFESTRAWKIAPSAADAGRDADLAEGAVDARGHAGAGRRRRRRSRPTAIPRVGHPDPDPGEEEARQQRRPAVADLDAVHQEQADADEDQAGAHQRPGRDPVRAAGRRSGRR